MTHRLNARVFLLLGVAISMLCLEYPLRLTTAQEPPSRAPFSLDVPALKLSGITTLEVRVPATKIDTLRIRIAQPYADKIDYNRIYTTLNAESANKIQTVKAAANGKIVELDLESRAELQLRPGKNVVEISASDSNRQQYYASFVIITGSSARPASTESVVPAGSEEFFGRKYALVVGVSRYKFHEGGLNDLRYADADAQSVARFLKTRAGFQDDDVSYLENEKATVEGVRAALSLFLTRARENDFVFLFIASHGAQDRFDPKNLYLILHDTKITDMPRTALRMSELQDLFSSRLRAKRMVLVIDACHSAAVGAPGPSTRQLERVDNNTFGLYAEKIFNDEGKALLTSSDINEVSEEGSNWGGGHGVFTWSVLQGLGGGADMNRDRVITTGELFDFVSKQVRHETQGRQNPRALPGTNRNFPLTRVQS